MIIFIMFVDEPNVYTPQEGEIEESTIENKESKKMYYIFIL